MKITLSKNPVKIEDIIAVLYTPVPDLKIVRENSALLLINFVDYVSFFTKTATSQGLPEMDVKKMIADFDLRAKKAASNAGELLKAWRERGFEIFHVKSEIANNTKKNKSDDRVKTGLKLPSESDTLAFYEVVKPRKGELVFSQESLDAFASTNLDFVLRNMQVDTLAICGLMTDQSVLFNTVKAVNLGYNVLLVEDACTTLTAENHANFIKWYKTFVNVKSTNGIISMIEKG